MPPARPPTARTRRISRSWALLSVLAIAVTGAACSKRSETGALTPPPDAPGWESRYRNMFDDDYTPEAINLQGRAPNDVRDQRLLAGRLGNADIIAQVQVLQVWGEGRYQGRPEQYLEVEIEQVLLGKLAKGTAERQHILVIAEDELPGTLQGQDLLLFLRWSPDTEPPYRHHLMPVEPESMAYIAALIQHAKAEGVLDEDGVPTEGSRRKGKRKKRKRKKDDEDGG